MIFIKFYGQHHDQLQHQNVEERFGVSAATTDVIAGEMGIART